MPSGSTQAQHHPNFVKWHTSVGDSCTVKLTDGSILIGELACVDPVTSNLLLLEPPTAEKEEQEEEEQGQGQEDEQGRGAGGGADGSRRATLVFGGAVVSCVKVDTVAS